jgi:hypothetical protein
VSRSEKLGLDITVPAEGLLDVIQALSEKHGKKVVVLIDEYDAPVSNNVGDLGLAIKNRDVLKDFYSGLKDSDKFLRFVFVAGVTRYAFMGLSAGLNQLTDLTLDERRADICGFTREELRGCFAEYFPPAFQKLRKDGNPLLAGAAVSDLPGIVLDWYDGYSWDGKARVLNPFSVVSFFDAFQFERYWMNQDPSAKLISALMSKDPFAFTADKLRALSVEQVSVSEVGALGPVSALFQTGYLTVDKIAFAAEGTKLYSFRLPNNEVRPKFESIFSGSLYEFFKKEPGAEKTAFKAAVLSGDGERLTQMLRSVLASVPAIHHRPEESYYHSVLFGYFHGMPETVMALPEQPGAAGTPDLVLVFADGLCVVMELKYKRGEEPGLPEDRIQKTLAGLADGGLKAIQRKRYCWPYLEKARRIVKIGIGIYGRGHVLAKMEDEIGAGMREASSED